MGFDRKEYDKSTIQILIKFQDSDPVIHALSDMREKTGDSYTVYLKKALVEKLRNDGYLSPDKTIVIKGPGRRTHEQRLKYKEPDYRDPLD